MDQGRPGPGQRIRDPAGKVIGMGEGGREHEGPAMRHGEQRGLGAGAGAPPAVQHNHQIGRASCRERV